MSALATRFGFGGEYFLIYSPLSELGHAQGIQHDLNIEAGQVEVHSPNDPTAFGFIAYWSCSWQLLTLVYTARAYSRESHDDLEGVNRKVQSALESIADEAAAVVL